MLPYWFILWSVPPRRHLVLVFFSLPAKVRGIGFLVGSSISQKKEKSLAIRSQKTKLSLRIIQDADTPLPPLSRKILFFTDQEQCSANNNVSRYILSQSKTSFTCTSLAQITLPPTRRALEAGGGFPEN